jgi:hypothetical protein
VAAPDLLPGAAPDLLPGGKGGPDPRGWPRCTGLLGVRLPHVAAPDHPAGVRARGGRS